ncbi:hypothetical protein ABT160_05190 [Streptomyces sp. NPDC001941]|uniref:hypothetical protein n=1 Tax=Streptomyces sp. NPDC001941 TaxID=3154659 RepID=UPI003322E90F
MSSPCDPKYASVGDVGAALMVVDSRIKALHSGTTADDPEHRALVEQYVASLGPEGADALLDGACTLIYMFMRWLRVVHEDLGKDVMEYVVPTLVATMRMMPKTFRPEVIPTMAALVIAAGTDLSPSLWRQQYGEWTEPELNALEATTVLLAEHINRVAGDTDFATRMVSEAISRMEEDGEEDDQG